MRSVPQVCSILLAALCLFHGGEASAQSYPARPVRLIVPFAPSGSTDIIGRVLAQKLGEALGQQFVVDNRPGAGGNIGTDLAAKAVPDGHTLVLVTVAYAINPSIYKKMPFDPVRDLTPVGLVASAPDFLVVHPSVGATTIPEFIEVAKKTPLFYASAGNGTPTQLAAELSAAHGKASVSARRGVGPSSGYST